MKRYWRAWRRYHRETEKGRRDERDYLRAAILFMLICLALYGLGVLYAYR